MSETVTGKAAWDALGEGKALYEREDSTTGRQIVCGAMQEVWTDTGCWHSGGGISVARILREKWIVRPRIGDAPPWSES